MKAFIFLAVVTAVRATVVQVAPALVAVETGDSAQFRSEDNLGNYNFGYNEDHTSGGSFRREAGDAHGNVAGSYGLRDADGRIRIVNYIANDDGFKADIKTNEPGVEPKDTADASFNKAESVVVQSAVAVPAPAPVVAIPAAEPIALKTEQFAVEAPIFQAPVAVAPVKSIAAFPAPATVPVAKSLSTTITTAETRPVAYAFPEPAIAPVAKTHSTVIASRPLPYALAPAAIPVAKSQTTTITQTHPVTYSFPPAAPIAKTISAPVAYSVPAPAVSVATKTVAAAPAAVVEAAPVTYSFPAPAAPVAKTLAAPIIAEPAPIAYSFPAPAAVPVAKSSSVTTYAAAPIAPIAKSSSVTTYAAAPIAPVAYSAHALPAHYAVKSAYAPITYAPRYAVNTYLSNLRYAAPHYRSLYSPAVASFAGPVPYFSNIEYHGYPVVKK